MKRLINIFLGFIHLLKLWFWIKPTGKPEPVKAIEVIDQYIVIDYKGQYINLRKSELLMFEKLSREDKRAMAQKFKILQKKGKVRFEKINGQTIAIWNKDYEQKADLRKHGNDQTGSRQRPNKTKKRH